MLLRHRIGRRLGGLWSGSHWQPGRLPDRQWSKVSGMKLPPKTGDDRRAVPRHLRDSEHDMSGAAPGSGIRAEDADGSRRMRAWIYAVIAALVVATTLWIGLAAT